MGIRRLWLSILGILALIATGGSAFAERRVALVIGNAKYEHVSELLNPLNDAKAVSDLLTRAGFDLVEHRDDLSVLDFKRAVREFADKAADADVAVVYYSGHGIELDGANYLIPIDASLAGALDVEDETVPLDRLLTSTQNARKLGLIILDACRENPFLRATGTRSAMRGLSSGLSSVSPRGQNTLIAYAAKAGSVSYDGIGSNSPFTTALVKYLAKPGLDIRIALGKVRDEVVADTGGKQEPFVYGSLGGDNVSIVPAKSQPETANVGLPSAVSSEALDYQFAERIGSLEAWRAFVAAHPKGYYAQLAQAQIEKASGVASVGAPPPIQIASTRRTTATEAPAAPKPDGGAEPVAASSDDVCKRDAEKLARLRANPSAEAAIDLDRKMTCGALRPQLARLMESLGVAPSAKAAAETPPAQAEIKTATEDNCDSEAGQLARLRAAPDLNAVKTFLAGLTCARLRPQATRLMESLAD